MNVSTCTVRRFQERGLIASRLLLLTARHWQDSLRFARNHRESTIHQWGIVSLSDVSRSSLSDLQLYVNGCGAFNGGSIMAWGWNIERSKHGANCFSIEEP